MKDKVVIITGSGGGIGKAMARTFCSRGAKVMLNGRDPEKLERTRLELSAAGYIVEATPADLTDFTACQQLVARTISAFGKIDILIANAGDNMYAGFADTQPQFFKQVFDNNIYSTLFPVKAALDHIRASRGSIVLIGSVAGLYGLPFYAAYSMGKMALTAFSQTLRAELSPDGVHVGIIYVGFAQNEPEKRIVSADGRLIPVPPSSSFLQLSREKVADTVWRFTQNRRHQQVLSAPGKVLAFLATVWPGLVRFLFNRWVRRQTPNSEKPAQRTSS